MKLSILAGLAGLALACAANDGGLPWDVRAESWRTDAAWYDGKAEVAVYDATRTIYGVERRYVASAYTNKQRMDPATTVKAAGDGGVEVFKHHWSERVPTEYFEDLSPKYSAVYESRATAGGGS